MSDRPSASPFPLPLAPFEEYMLVDDRPAYPAVGFLRFLFGGHFDRVRLAAAFAAAVARHPLLAAVVEPSRGGRFQWTASQNVTPELRWVPPEAPLAVQKPWKMDLRRESGLRVHVRESGGRTGMLVQIHHACSDAIGLASFVNDMLAFYDAAGSPQGEKKPPVPIDPERLRGRGRFGLTKAGWLARLPKDFLASLAAIEYFGHRPVPVAPPAERERPEDFEPLFPTASAQTLSESESARLHQTARELDCTVNDILLAAAFLALYRWNLLRRPESNKGVLRIMIPMNLRTPGARRMPAANVVSYVYLDRRGHRFGRPRALIRSVRREMKICKKWRLGLTLIHFIRLFRRLPGGLARMLPEDRPLATAVVSNFGELGRSLTLPERDGRLTAGNTVLERFDILPPVRPWTCASFGANSYARRVGLSVHCDPHRFTPADAAELLGTFVRQVVAVSEDPDATVPVDALP